MSAGASKRAVAEIRFGEDRAGVSKVAGRSIHQYWSMLSPHFRDVFLAPQRRSDDGGVSWTWREPTEKTPLTATELAGVRSRLERAKESFEENPVSQLMSEARGGGASSQETIDQLTARVKTISEGLAGKPDAALSEFVCRTETGVMVHSWGLSAAAKIYYPDSLESGVGGIVLFGGKGSEGNDVVIENSKGLRVARTTTDEAGEFNFTKITPGRYRVRVISGPGEFSSKGVSVNVERGEMARVELRSTSDPEAPAAEGAESSADHSATDTSAPLAAKKRRSIAWIIAVAALFFLGGGVWVWRVYFRSANADTQSTQRISTLTPEDFSSKKTAAQSEAPTRVASEAGAGLGAVADGPGEEKSTASRREMPSVDAPALASRPEAAGGSVSKIGTRVELSGVNSPGGAAVGSQKGLANPTRGASGAPSSNNAMTEALSDSAEAAVDSETETRGENSKTVNAAAVSLADAKRAPGGGGAAETLSGSMPTGSGVAQPDSPAGSDSEKKPGLGVATGLPADGKKTASSKGAGLSVADRGKSDAAEEAIAGSAAGQATSLLSGEKPVSGQGPKAAVTVVEKPAKKSAAAASTGDGKAADPSTDNSAPDGAPGEQTGGAEKSKSGKSARSQDKTPNPKEDGSSDSATSSAAATTATSAEPSSTATDSGKSETPEAGKDNSSEQNNSAPSDAAKVESTPTSAVTAPTNAAKKPERAVPPLEVVPPKPLPMGMQVMGGVKLGDWWLRVGRDAIVPTVPVREGENDSVEVLRRKMLDEQRMRLPMTLRSPVLQGGFVFKFAAGVKVQPLRWSVVGAFEFATSVKENRAEVGWALDSVPRIARLSLAFADGTEVARVEFDDAGRATVAVRPELRVALWLGATYAEDDLRTGGSARFAWQVVRGPLASSAWTYDSRWRDGTGCRLEAVMNGANPVRTRIALTDQTSGWALATELE